MFDSVLKLDWNSQFWSTCSKIIFLCNNLGFAQNFWCFSISVLTFLPTLESSANLDREVRASLITWSSMFIYIYNKIQRSKDTPLGYSRPNQTKSRRMIYYCNKHWRIFSFHTIWASNNFARCQCKTLSNAFAKSRYVTLTESPLSILVRIVSRYSSRFVMHDFFPIGIPG